MLHIEADDCQRTAIAPLLVAALAAAAGVIADRHGGWFSTATWVEFACCSCVCAFVVRRWPAAAICFALVATASLGGARHHSAWYDLAPGDIARGEWTSRRDAELRGVLVTSPEYRPPQPPFKSGSTRAELAVTSIRDGDLWRGAVGRVAVFARGDFTTLRMGEPVRVSGQLRQIDGPRNPGERDQRELPRSRGIRLRVSVTSPSGIQRDPSERGWFWTRLLGKLRSRSHALLVRRLHPRIAPLATALLLGNREEVVPEVNDAFLRTGTMHLLAISGVHLQVMAVLVLGICRAIGMGWKQASLVVAASVIAYALLVGGMPSVVRAAVMTLVGCAAVLLDRQTNLANVMGAAALVLMLLNPSNVFDFGCQLSFLGVTALVWGVPLALEIQRAASRVMPSPESGARRAAPGVASAEAAEALDALEQRFEPPWNRALRSTWRHVALVCVTSLVTTLFTLPLVAFRAHLISASGIVLNVPLIPLTTIALVAAGLTLALGPIGGLPGWVCTWTLRLSEWVVLRGARWSWGHAFAPGPSWWWVCAFYLMLGIVLFSRRARQSVRWALRGVFLAWILFGWLRPAPRPATLEADILAVDHGLAVVVQSAEGRVLVYDCGKLHEPGVGRFVIAPALWHRGIDRIDELILSHADADHYDGLADLLDRFTIGAVIVPPRFGGYDAEATQLLNRVRARGIPVRTVAAGARWGFGPNAAIRVMHPPRAWPSGRSDNEGSLVVELASRGTRFLLTGDVDGYGLIELMSQPIDPVAALLSPHHGGRTANPPRLYAWSRPARVIASQAQPRSASRDALASLDMPVLRTWERGAIRLVWSSRGLIASGFLDANEPISAPTGSSHSFSMRVVLAIVAFVVGAALIAVLAIVEWGAWTLVRPGRRINAAARPADDWARVEVETPDGVRLAGVWKEHASSGGRSVLLVHGFGEDRAALEHRAEAMYERGWSVAALDMRNRGSSGGDLTTFGAIEFRDVSVWIDHLSTLASESPRWAAWGRSMGAAIVLRAAVNDDRIQAIVLEAPYADLKRAVRHWLKRWRVPSAMAGPILGRAAALAGVSLSRPRPIDIASRVRIPVMIVHGEGDPVVPSAEVLRLAGAFARSIDRIAIPDARHTDVFDAGGPALADLISAFLDRAARPNT